MAQDKSYLRSTFDEDASLYDQARPGYPEALFEDIITFSGISPNGRILEIGSGTGQATLPMARRGYHIFGIELGPHMATVARHNLAPYPLVDIYTGAFEDWPLEQNTFDLAFSATAFHWLDPSISYQKTAQTLKTSGTLALFWNIPVQHEASQGFFEAVQPIYQRELQHIEKNYYTLPWPDDVPEPVKTEIEQTNLFNEVTVYRYCWHTTYDATSYLSLLNTYSDHRALDNQKRERLLHSIANLIETQFDGHITKGYLTILYLARRK